MMLDGTDTDELHDQINKTKKQLRIYIVSSAHPSSWVQHPDNLVSSESILGWQASALNPTRVLAAAATSTELSPAFLDLQSYFAVLISRIRVCPGHEPGLPVHYHISSILSNPVYILPSSHFADTRNGSLNTYVRQRCGAFSSFAKSIPCWRHLEDNVFCTRGGGAEEYTIWVGLPLVLCVEVAVGFNDNATEQPRPPLWNFETVLYPLQGAEPKKVGVVYDLVARAFTNCAGTRHFMGRYTATTDTPTFQEAIFTYDGMLGGGMSARESGARAVKLGGKAPPLGKDHQGYHTVAVYYVLRGQQAAQAYFHQSQSNTMREMFPFHFEDSPDKTNALSSLLTLHDTDFEEVPIMARAWVSAASRQLYHSRFNAPMEYDRSTLR